MSEDLREFQTMNYGKVGLTRAAVAEYEEGRHGGTFVTTQSGKSHLLAVGFKEFSAWMRGIAPPTTAAREGGKA